MFKLWKSDKDGQHYFSFEHGETRLASEGYKERAGALNGIASVRSNAPVDGRYYRKSDGSGHFFWFVLKAANGEIIAKLTQQRKTQAELETDIAVVKKQAPVARLEG